MRKIIYFLFIFFILSACGCSTMRKKFVRAKHKEVDPAVYVDYKDYDQIPSPEHYKDYYLFAQAWLSEAAQSLDSSCNRKKQAQSFSEALVNIEQMFYFLDEEGRLELSAITGRLKKLEKDIPLFSRNEMRKNMAVREIENLMRDFKRKFSMKNAAQWMD